MNIIIKHEEKVIQFKYWKGVEVMNFGATIIIFIILLMIILINMRNNKKLIRLNGELKLQTVYLQGLLDNSQDGVLILDNKDKIINANKSFQRIFKYKNDELKGMLVNNVIADCGTKDAFEMSNTIINGGTINLETKRKRKDGILVDVRVNGFPFILDNNQIGMCAIYKDITSKRDSEKELELQRIYFSQLFENTPEATCIIDSEDRFINVNAAFEKLFGYPKEELINYHINDRIVNSESIEEATKISENVMKRNIIEHETQRMRRDGSIVEVSILGYPIILENKQIGVFGIYKDITERNRSDKALKASEYTFRMLFEGSSDAIFIMENYKVIDCNKAAIELLKFPSKASIFSKSPWDISPEKQPDGRFSKEKALDIISNTEKDGKFRFEWWHKRSDNTLVPVEIMLTSILLNGKKVIHALYRDVSERKKMEQELEYLSYHDQLTGLYNRRFYEEELRRLDTERNFPITLVMADVNGLKLTNDAFGHKAGDMLLEKIANILVRECRADEIIARIGGDEFVLLLPRTDEKEAEKIVKRINVAIAKGKTTKVILSISMGYAVKQNSSENMNEVFRKAEDYMYRHKLSESSSIRSKTIDLIMNSLYEKNHREMLHSKRVSEICEAIANGMNFEKDDINQIRITGLMHDIGKIGINDNILNKVEKLNKDEWAEIKRHSEIGYRILSSVNEFSQIADYVLEHHERWDGKGYPKGLKGEEISIEARIIAVADSYDAMMSDRAYRKALSEEEAINEIRRCCGTQFDPDVAKVFVEKILGKVL